MPSLDDLLERLRSASGAEFAFALTRKGALTTRDAPQAMPEVGRMRLVRAADAMAPEEVVFVSLARGELVPYGGPWPIDVGLAVMGGSHLVCLAMTSADGRGVARAALEAERSAIEATLGPVIEVRGQAVLGQESLAAIALDKLKGEAPTITIGAAPTLGRETLAAIEVDASRTDAPRISVEPARKLGRETLAAIEADIAVSGPAAERPPIPPDLRRGTLPWIESPVKK